MNPPQPNTSSEPATVESRRENRRWWIRLLVQPALLLLAGVVLLTGLGLAQRMGWLGGDGGHQHAHTSGAEDGVSYICPMMCTPPQSEPGRCPVCGMELRPVTAGATGGMNFVQIDPVARRVANIQTVSVQALPASRTIQAIGELNYDEGRLKTISAYVDGRIDRLYADYTGVVVEQGDRLALVYSPELYSGQVELLLAKKSADEQRSAASRRFGISGEDLYETARQRLLELGMTAEQISQIEKAGEASSRLHLHAPISGTVIEKHAVEGQYVKEGQPIYRLADLSSLWLMLRLFPEDAAAIRYGQRVEAVVQSLPHRTFTGRVAFVDPNVEPKTRTVGVRVVIENPEGVLRVGDFAKATIEVPLGDRGEGSGKIYDPDLADKWISPRHPHVISSEAGDCPVCGIEMLPAAQFGYTDEPGELPEVVMVPRGAVLMAGGNSVVYVETEPGRFELREVVTGAQAGDQVVVHSGLKAGEQVASRGNFLIDSQMQLAGNPSLIDPTKAIQKMEEITPADSGTMLAGLSEEERRLVEKQKICPVTDLKLGGMGQPRRVDVQGGPVFICCNACRDDVLNDPEKYLKKLRQISTDADEADKSPTSADRAEAVQ